MQPKKLEQYKFFQPFAWALCLLFATFVALLALQLQTVADKLEAQNMSLEERLQNLENEVYQN